MRPQDLSLRGKVFLAPALMLAALLGLTVTPACCSRMTSSASTT